MSSSIYWIFALCILSGFILQGYFLRVFHRRSLDALCAEHQQVLSQLQGEFEQLTSRLRQLQRSREATTPTAMQLRTAASKTADPPTSVREALERELDASSDPDFTSATDGFADNQIQAHDAQSSSLLMQ